MPPTLAAFACLLFIAYLFWDDVRTRDGQQISWAPFVWMSVAGSRFVSHWLTVGGPAAVSAYDEGSPVDRALFLSLIVWGSIVLARRNIRWRQLLADNKWILLYLVYCLASVVWSDEPFVLTKRWVKDLGNPIMALVLLTEPRPYQAVGTTLRRLSYVLLPLSVLFCKYYPALGRAYKLDGTPMFTGVGDQKNSLGLACLVIGIYFAWRVLYDRPNLKAHAHSRDLIDAVLVGMMLWLLYISDSKTSIGCLLLVTAVLAIGRLPLMSSRPSRVVPFVTAAALLFVCLDATFGVKDRVFGLMGRDSTLTNRVNIWQTVRKHAGNPLVGTGFMSFWSPGRTAAVERELGAGLNQAHNGYLEQYLNLGYIGVGFIVVIMLSALLKVWRHLGREPSPAMLMLSFLVASGVYNYTEASFYGVNNMWLLLLIASIDTTGAVAWPSPVMDTRVPVGLSRGTQNRRRWRIARRQVRTDESPTAALTSPAASERPLHGPAMATGVRKGPSRRRSSVAWVDAGNTRMH